MTQRFWMGSLAAVSVAACASPPDLVVASPIEPRRAFEELVRGFGDGELIESAPEEGRIETDWRERETERTSGLLFPKAIHERERLRFEVRPAGDGKSEVAVWIRTEEWRPAGSQSLRWQRTAIREARREALLEEIERALSVPSPNEKVEE